ncbi:hypothetical protein CRUP_014166 [Coryphaenoides rupestris]|nr:hypothetical protein CRUP_014166 [Coryphaenoides rupestris]
MLIECMKQKDLKQLQALHQGGGADLAALDASGCTLLHHAVAAGYKEAVRYLLDHGESRLTDAQPGRGRSLVTNSREPQRGETALHRAATLCQRTICHYLVEAGASLMKTDLQREGRGRARGQCGVLWERKGRSGARSGGGSRGVGGGMGGLSARPRRPGA